MLEFFIVLFLFTAMSIYTYFNLGRRDFENAERKSYQLDIPVETRRKLGIMVRLFCKLLAVITIIYIVIPMALDIPFLLNNDYRSVKGSTTQITSGPFGSWYLRQTVTIEGKRVKIYFNNKPIRQNRDYKIYYLPRSAFGVFVEEIK